MLAKKIKRQISIKEPCLFLEKLYTILMRVEYKEYIDWSENGEIINISDKIKFSNKILPKFFKHNKYSSFIRQLYLYGFHKIPKIKNSKNEQFINPNFTRYKTLKEIKEMKKKNTNHYSNED